MKRVVLLSAFLVIVSLVAACGSDNPGQPGPTSTPGLLFLTPTATPTVDPADFRMLGPGDTPRRPVGALDTSKTYTATIKTEKGDIVIELFDDIAAIYVENFINLARTGYYDNTTFHRVIGSFVAQAGTSGSTGSDNPGYRFNDQFHPDMHNDAGRIAMANSGLNTNGSQFFITFTDQRRLDPYDASGNLKSCQIREVSCHAVFGKVVEGMDVLLNITLRDPQLSPAYTGDVIHTIVIEES